MKKFLLMMIVVLTVVTFSGSNVKAGTESPFDPEATYYQSSSLTVNGDFEAFDVGTVLSESQLPGSWGTINLDGPAKIVEVDGSKRIAMTRTQGKQYSSAFLMTPVELGVKDLVRLTYDYKIITNFQLSAYQIDSSFVGSTNVPYFEIDLTNQENNPNTSGAEQMTFPVIIKELENGWFNVTLDFQVTTELLVKCDSIRWLFTPLSDSDAFYIDNVNLYFLTTEEATQKVTSITINESDQELEVGDTVQLSATIAPTDAANKNVTWSSTNSDVASVDENGLVTAKGKGACEIKVTTEDGSKNASIVISVTEPVKADQNYFVYIISGVVFISLATVVFIVISSRKRRV